MSMKTIVSITSHGRRVAEAAPIAISTLLRQTYQPDKIVLYLDNDYTDDLPPPINHLISDKFEVRREYENIGPHSKWFWAMQEFPDDLVILADDDMQYNPDTIQLLVERHKQFPDKIVCFCKHWHNDRIWPLHLLGVLYPPRILSHVDLFNKELITTLTPIHDEMWLWAMSRLSNVDIIYARDIDPMSWEELMEFSPPIDPGHHCCGTSLASCNVGQNQENRQLKNIIKYYPQLLDYLELSTKTV